MSDWIVKIERVTDGYYGTNIEGELLGNSDSTAVLPRYGDHFRLVPLSLDQVNALERGEASDDVLSRGKHE